MTSRLFQKAYTREKPFVSVRISVVNPYTSTISTFDDRCWVDTGFFGGIHVPEFRISDVRTANITPRLTTVTLAGGVRARAHECLAYLQQIESLALPSPGMEVELIMQGHSSYGLLGLEVLKRWIVKFNGPSQLLEFC